MEPVAPAAVLVQLSDVHIGSRLGRRRADAYDELRRAVAAVAALDLAVDLVVVTGDLAEHGRAAEYAQLVAALDELPCPYVLAAGNHDDPSSVRALMADRLPLAPGLASVTYAADVGPLRLLVLDSCVPGRDHGRVGPEQCAWLDAELRAYVRPTVVVVHHPPVAIGHALLDTMFLADADALGAVIERHAHVERIICGHVHRAVAVRWRGTVVTTAPSGIRQFGPAFRPDAPFVLSDEAPGMAVHVWVAGALVTHVIAIE